jgi:hypothetical protein
LDGKKRKDQASSSKTDVKVTYQRGVPDYNYKIGTLRFIRNSRPPSKEVSKVPSACVLRKTGNCHPFSNIMNSDGHVAMQDPCLSLSFVTEDSFHQQIGLKFKDETRKVPHLEHSLYGAENLMLRRVAQKYESGHFVYRNVYCVVLCLDMFA